MSMKQQEERTGTIAAYDLLASIFLTLPDENLVKSIIAGGFKEGLGSAGLSEVAQFGNSQQNRPIEDILLDISRDRARLIRGVNKEGIEPPYESLYVGHQANMTIGSLNKFYSELGYTMTDDVKDAPDQLGVELAFAKQLLERTQEALGRGDTEEAARYEALHESFLRQHLGRWGAIYGKNMAQSAETGFYRGIGLLLDETLS